MLSTTIIADAVRRTDEAERTRRQVRALSFEQPEMTIDDGYAIQRLWVEQKVAAGATVRGHKLGAITCRFA
jgi:2-oxo-hept-3-ene-1,7-dioate hydratase